MRVVATSLILLLSGLASGLDLPVLPRMPWRAVETTPPANRETPPGSGGLVAELPAPTFFGARLPRVASIVFVVDTSGSMSHLTPALTTRLEAARRELVAAIQGLHPAISFDVVLFNQEVLVWAPQLEPATAQRKAEAIAWVNTKMLPGGGTATGPAVVTALLLRPELLVLLTDGEPTVPGIGAPGHRAMIQRGNPEHVPIHVFGIGVLGPWRGFCLGVASDSGGVYRDVG